MSVSISQKASKIYSFTRFIVKIILIEMLVFWKNKLKLRFRLLLSILSEILKNCKLEKLYVNVEISIEDFCLIIRLLCQILQSILIVLLALFLLKDCKKKYLKLACK